MVHPDGRVVLLDYGITGRLTNRRRLIFLNMLMSAIAGTIVGAPGLPGPRSHPPETDLDVFMEEIRLDRPGSTEHGGRRPDDLGDAQGHQGTRPPRPAGAQGAHVVMKDSCSSTGHDHARP